MIREMNVNGSCRKTEGNRILRRYRRRQKNDINPLNTELHPICHFVALLGAHHILHVSRIRVKNDLKKEGYRLADCRPRIKMVVRSKRLMNQRLHKWRGIFRVV